MKIVFKIVFSKIFFFIITTIVILGLNITPLIMQNRNSPTGRTFGMIHNNVQDFYFYQSLMNEGANGTWLTSDPYTSESHQPSIIFSYFLWLGKLSKLLNLSYAVTYHLARVFLGFLFLLASYYLLFFLKIPHPRLTFFFFVFAAPFMHTINDYGTLRSVPFMAWWNGIDPIRRAAFLPHHMLGGLLLLLSIILLFKFINKPARAAHGRLVLLSAVMAFVHTPSLLILLLIVPSSLFLHYLILKTGGPSEGSQKNFKTPRGWQADPESIEGEAMTPPMVKESTIGLLVYWVLGLFFLLLMVSQTKNGFPWSQYIDWEKNLQFPLERELIGALGILSPFALVGIYSAIKSKKLEYIFTVCWLVVPFLFIPIAPKLNLSNIRLIQGVPYLPLAILAILGMQSTLDFIKGWRESGALLARTPLVHGSTNRVTSDRTPKLILLGIVLLFFIFTYPTLSWSVKDQIREFMPVYGNVYLDNRLFSAFDYINNNFPQRTITVCTFYCGNYLPAYTHTVSFSGHFGYTYKETEKGGYVQKFFEGKMSIDEAKDFLMNNKITLVFQGPEEKGFYNKPLYPTLLKPIYDKEEATIYSPTL